MFPIVFVGIAVAALLAKQCGGGHPTQANPENSDPEPAEPGFDPPPSSVDKVETAGPREKRKLSPDEFRELVEGMRECLEVQREYGTSCPPPGKLPPGCSCEEVPLPPGFMPPALDPAAPDRFREQMLSRKRSEPIEI